MKRLTLVAVTILCFLISPTFAQSPDKILKQAIKALGGEKNLKRITSWQASGKITRQSDQAGLPRAVQLPLPTGPVLLLAVQRRRQALLDEALPDPFHGRQVDFDRLRDPLIDPGGSAGRGVRVTP